MRRYIKAYAALFSILMTPKSSSSGLNGGFKENSTLGRPQNRPHIPYVSPYKLVVRLIVPKLGRFMLKMTRAIFPIFLNTKFT